MARIALVIIGHSHLASMVAALQPRAGEEYRSDIGCEYIVYNTHRHGSDFQFSVPDPAGGYQINPELVDLVNERVPPDYKRVFISMFGGNAHNALTLLEHPEPFDFILPGQPNCPRVPNAQLLPYDFLGRFIHSMAAVYMLNLETLYKAFKDPIIHIESPPPIGDDQFVMDNLDQYFAGQYEDPRPAPRWLRYKLWRLHSALVSEHAKALGVDFLPAPSDSMDSEGFLVREDYGTDATHAGPNYALRVMKQIESRMGMGYGGWNWL
jgi:hypothetical protein